MTRRQALALSLAGIALAPGEAPGQGTVPIARSTIPRREVLARVGLERAWSAPVPLGFGTEVVQSISQAEDMLFVQTNMANLHAYAAETGKYLWGMSLGARTLDARPVSVNSDQAFVTDGPFLYGLNRRTGTVEWKTRMETTAVGATAASEERVMVGLANGKMTAFNTRDRTKASPAGRSPGTMAWTWQTGKVISARPVPAGRVVAFASQDGRLYVAQDDPHQLLFRYLTGGPIVGSLGTIGVRTVIVPSEDRNVYAVDLYRGDTKWVVPTGSPIDQEPLVAGNTVFVLNTSGRLLAIDGTTGATLWDTTSGGGRLLALGASRIYMLSHEGDLALVDRASGKLLASPRDTRERSGLDLRDFRFGLTNYTDDRLYFATRGGFLLALREVGSTAPRLLRDPKAPKFGYLPPEGEPQEAPPPLPEEGDDAAKPEGAADAPKP